MEKRIATNALEAKIKFLDQEINKAGNDWAKVMELNKEMYEVRQQLNKIKKGELK